MDNNEAKQRNFQPQSHKEHRWLPLYGFVFFGLVAVIAYVLLIGNNSQPTAQAVSYPLINVTVPNFFN